MSDRIRSAGVAASAAAVSEGRTIRIQRRERERGRGSKCEGGETDWFDWPLASREAGPSLQRRITKTSSVGKGPTNRRTECHPVGQRRLRARYTCTSTERGKRCGIGSGGGALAQLTMFVAWAYQEERPTRSELGTPRIFDRAPYASWCIPYP